MKKLKIFIFFCAISGLAGCIPIDDFGNYWNEGSVDPVLEGHWKKLGVEFRSQDEYITFEKEGDYYRYYRSQASMPLGDPKMRIKSKTIALGDTSFLMLASDPDMCKQPMPTHAKQAEEAVNSSTSNPRLGGGLQRYEVSDGQLIFFYLDEQVLTAAITNGTVEGRLPDNGDPQHVDLSTATILRLDDQAVQFIELLLADPKNWNRVEAYTQVADLDRALEESRRYPSTSETLQDSEVLVNLPDLAYFSGSKSGMVQRHLEASPEWKVFEDRGETVAYQRESLDGDWKVSLNGYRNTGPFKGRLQTRKLFRFSKEGGGAFINRYNRDRTIVVGPLCGKTNLNMHSSGQGISSYIAAGIPGLWFEFFEQSKQEERSHTRAALEWLETFLSTIRQAESQVEQSGFVPELIPENGIRKGTPSLRIREGFQGGIFNVFAWANPGKPGVTFLRVFDVAKGDALSADRVLRKSNERIGWSDEPEQLFSYNAHVTIYEGDWDDFYEARFELWHRSDTGEEEKLIETSRRINGWQR